jgi:hypothetical protein
MELTLSQRDRDAIVQQLRIALRKDIKAILQDTRQPDMVTTREAASILGITPGRLRQIVCSAPLRYPHTKKGNNKQGQLLFKRSALLI